MAADLPVLVEKPLGYTLADIDALGGSDLVQLGYMKLFDPAVCRAVELLAQRPAPRAVDVTVLPPSATSIRVWSSAGRGTARWSCPLRA